ncbi:MAG: adenosylhomocysteinase [Thermoprotei archaeon]|nr:adenosylhomocysteinase [Thermoproteales archaeon]RLE78080.1 MAG: adenosylhomocysteinase [Thermoprotei archaeon]RLE86191.1 MAG: adenosylhomocysteinase [Thermoprotei archaeon]
MKSYAVKNISLSSEGEKKIYWAEKHMPVLALIRKNFKKTKPFENVTIGACLHVTKETAVLVSTLKSAGAEIYLSASNPLSTQDEVAAALAGRGIHVFAWRGMSKEEYYRAIGHVVKAEPMLTMDDGADLTACIHGLYYKEYAREDVKIVAQVVGKKSIGDIVENIVGGTEETTTGVLRLKAMAREGTLLYPIIAVNDSYTKFLFDNRHGTGQSALDGIIRATNMLIAGKTVVVAGYGWVGRGIALRAKGLGANVVVVEVNPIRALEALYDGFYVTNMITASKIGDLFITATGNRSVIRKEHFLKMKNGAILANAGHFNVEIDLEDLENISTSKKEIKTNVTEYTLKNGKKIYLLCEGRLVNLAAAEGHPPEVMDMSFTNQALALLYLLKKNRKLKKKVYRLPLPIDRKIAELKLKSLNVKIEKLTKDQREYLKSWKLGT